jgi:hypothetical protein
MLELYGSEFYLSKMHMLGAVVAKESQMQGLMGNITKPNRNSRNEKCLQLVYQ